MDKTKAITRKLHKVGGGYMVVIPSELVEKNKLKVGDKLGVVVDSLVVIVSPK